MLEPNQHALPAPLIERLVRQALQEDLGLGGDITTNSTIPKDFIAHVSIVARQSGCIAGTDLATATFKALDPAIDITLCTPDGSYVEPGTELLRIAGSARTILTGERVALNFLGHLSGIATVTKRYAELVSNHRAKVTSTRKTLPGLRAIQKYAIRVGGGQNHRLALDDAILIKDNHIAIAGSVAIAIERAKQHAGHMVKIEVEVDTIEQLHEALNYDIDVVLLDNMDTQTLERAVEIVDGKILTEASGGITLETVEAIAATGVDLISIGALTHSVTSFDLSLETNR
jgi:nicotinate-nucleotide pyrophosphorylase (carboxylating)